jgi:hypothetical protein
MKAARSSTRSVRLNALVKADILTRDQQLAYASDPDGRKFMLEHPELFPYGVIEFVKRSPDEVPDAVAGKALKACVRAERLELREAERTGDLAAYKCSHLSIMAYLDQLTGGEETEEIDLGPMFVQLRSHQAGRLNQDDEDEFGLSTVPDFESVIADPNSTSFEFWPAFSSRQLTIQTPQFPLQLQ